MKNLILITLCLGLFVIIGCEDTNSITNHSPSDQLPGVEDVSNGRQLLLDRVVGLQEEIQAGNLTPEARTEQIQTLVADIERWNVQPDVQNIDLLTPTSMDDGKGPKGPTRQPCLLIPPKCDPIKVINGWVCINTGVTSNCNSIGLRTCKYACVRITSAF